jgi:hypothetical protein
MAILKRMNSQLRRNLLRSVCACVLVFVLLIGSSVVGRSRVDVLARGTLFGVLSSRLHEVKSAPGIWRIYVHRNWMNQGDETMIYNRVTGTLRFVDGEQVVWTEHFVTPSEIHNFAATEADAKLFPQHRNRAALRTLQRQLWLIGALFVTGCAVFAVGVRQNRRTA